MTDRRLPRRAVPGVSDMVRSSLKADGPIKRNRLSIGVIAICIFVVAGYVLLRLVIGGILVQGAVETSLMFVFAMGLLYFVLRSAFRGANAPAGEDLARADGTTLQVYLPQGPKRIVPLAGVKRAALGDQAGENWAFRVCDAKGAWTQYYFPLPMTEVQRIVDFTNQSIQTSNEDV